ncbi:MAG: oligosaccharide flippase family protein, partial [Variibacter sp.]|nr:oligosaccharide flippase family protein [Variibacter sp.]
MVPSTAARGTGPRSIAAYARVMALGAGVRVFGLASQFVVLIILSRVLFKGTFGDMMTAFGFYRLVGTALGVGPSLVLIYHLSRHPNDRALEVRLHRYAAILAAACATAVALAGALLAQPVAEALGKPGLAPWFIHLAPFAIFSTLLGVATGALEGRSRVSTSITVGELAPNLVRIVLLPLIALLQLPDILVAHAITVSVLAPWLWAARGLFDRSIPGVQRWRFADFSYGGKFVVATLFASQLSTADVVVASALFPSETVADYAVASRLAALFSFLTLVLLKQFSPRAGYL